MKLTLTTAGLGPVIGGFAAAYKGYRWTQWCTIAMALFAFMVILPTQETYHKVLLGRRAKRLGLPSPNPELSPGQAMRLLLTITIFRPVFMLISEPIVLLLSLYNAFTFSVLFAFFAAYPYIFQRVYRFKIWQCGLAFLAVGVGVLLGVLSVISIDAFQRHRWLPEDRRINRIAPERRLYAGMLGAFCLPIG